MARDEEHRSWIIVAMKQRGGKGIHGGTPKAKNRRDRKSIRQELRHEQ